MHAPADAAAAEAAGNSAERFAAKKRKSRKR
jgi:hypothetical protein